MTPSNSPSRGGEKNHMGSIPPNAKRVFKGEIFEVYQWEQKMFDGSTEVFEMLKRPNTVQVIPIIGSRILVTSEEQPGRPRRDLGFFGGRGEEGEEPLVTAKRELLEEAGLESDDWELWKTYQPLVKADWTIYMFIARSCRKAAEPQLDAGEKIEIREIDFEKFIEMFTAEGYWSPNFSNDLLRLKLENRLDEFKQKLFPS